MPEIVCDELLLASEFTVLFRWTEEEFTISGDPWADKWEKLDVFSWCTLRKKSKCGEKSWNRLLYGLLMDNLSAWRIYVPITAQQEATNGNFTVILWLFKALKHCVGTLCWVFPATIALCPDKAIVSLNHLETILTRTSPLYRKMDLFGCHSLKRTIFFSTLYFVYSPCPWYKKMFLLLLSFVMGAPVLFHKTLGFKRKWPALINL